MSHLLTGKWICEGAGFWSSLSSTADLTSGARLSYDGRDYEVPRGNSRLTRPDIIVLLLLPDSSGGAALSALACIARKLRDPITMSRLRRAGDNAELYRALTQDVL